MVSLDDIRKVFPGTIRIGERIAGYSSLGVGGPADYLLDTSSPKEADALKSFFVQHAFPCLLLTGNMLVSDRGFRGAVIVNSREVTREGRRCATMFKASSGIEVESILEKAGVNGLLLGGAEVIGNRVVNANNASAGEIYALVRFVQQTVQQQCSITLELQLDLIGFDREELARVA